jgi:hypothetical protein
MISQRLALQRLLGLVSAGDRKPEEEFFNYYKANKVDEIYNINFTIMCAQNCFPKYFSHILFLSD